MILADFQKFKIWDNVYSKKILNKLSKILLKYDRLIRISTANGLRILTCFLFRSILLLYANLCRKSTAKIAKIKAFFKAKRRRIAVDTWKFFFPTASDIDSEGGNPTGPRCYDINYFTYHRGLFRKNFAFKYRRDRYSNPVPPNHSLTS